MSLHFLLEASRWRTVLLVMMSFSACGNKTKTDPETSLHRDTLKPQQLETQNFNVCGKNLELEIADEESERSLGLMFRDGVPAGKGMLFSFPESRVRQFWMKNVPFDIDIGFFDSKGSLVKHLRMAGTTPLMNENSLPNYSSQKPAQFAVEVQAGFFSNVGTQACKLDPVPKTAPF